MPSKEAVAKAILTRTPLRIHLDPRRDGVVVPARFRNDARLILEVGEKMRIQIPDLVVDALGVKATLRFSGEPFHCTVPWSAVFGLVDSLGRGKVWKEDTPADATGAVEDATSAVEDATDAPPHEKACSFCETTRENAKSLVTAERVSICDECIVAARATRSFMEKLRAFFVSGA